MSNIDTDLLLHLTLDEIRNSKFPDASGAGRDGVIKGNVTLVPDDLFGACASFDGKDSGFIEVADSAALRIAGDLTIEAWINVSEHVGNWVGVLYKGGSNKENYGLWYLNNNTWLFQSTSSGYKRCQEVTPEPSLELNTWYHMTGTLNGNKASLYIHDARGKLLLQKQQSDWAKPDTGSDPLRIGYAGSFNAHKGKIAGVRVYKRALSQSEIESDIREDCLSLVAFRKSHPLDFRLFDDDEQAVLYITDDKAGRNLNLELRNTSTQTIQLSDGQPIASETNHHFALRFRPGTLSENVINALVNSTERAKILTDADWDLFFPSQKPSANETVPIYLLYKGAAKRLQPNESRALTLHGMSAAPGSGARGTQVELIPRQMTAEGGDATPITGSRTQYLHVTNQTGKKNIPLHVGFVGGNNVLNNGSASNTLKLRITNVSKDAIILDAKSKFIVSFDAQLDGQTKEWALIEKNNSGNVKVKVLGNEITPEGIQGETPEWPITFNNPHGIAARNHIEVEISGIVSSIPAGHANIYVRYENIPGYWDGQFVCQVEKAPIVYSQEKVGIGTAAPAKTLDVKGDAAISGEIGAGKAKFGRATVENSDKLGTWLKLSNAGAGGVDWNIISTGSSNSEGVGRLLFKQGEGSGPIRMILDDKGNVGIGTTTPAKTLDVNGTVQAKKFEGEGAFVKGMIVMWSGAANALPFGWALCDGNNGTPNLIDKFIVAAGGKYTAGTTGGAESVKLEIRHMPKHNHPNSKSSENGLHSHRIQTTSHGWEHFDYVQSGDPGSGTGRSFPLSVTPDGSHTHSLNITQQGEDQPHENMPPYYAMAFIMKL